MKTKYYLVTIVTSIILMFNTIQSCAQDGLDRDGFGGQKYARLH